MQSDLPASRIGRREKVIDCPFLTFIIPEKACQTQQHREFSPRPLLRSTEIGRRRAGTASRWRKNGNVCGRIYGHFSRTRDVPISDAARPILSEKRGTENNNAIILRSCAKQAFGGGRRESAGRRSPRFKPKLRVVSRGGSTATRRPVCLRWRGDSEKER